MRSRQGDRRVFSKYIRNLVVWAFILVVVLYLVLPLYQNRAPSSEEIPYSAFVSEAQQGQIDQVKIGDEAVTGSKKDGRDRKSTRLNSSHGYTSYAVFCLK